MKNFCGSLYAKSLKYDFLKAVFVANPRHMTKQEQKKRQAKSFPHFLIQFSGISYAAGKRTRNYPQITQICADSGTEDLPRTGTSINRIRNAGTKEEAGKIFSSFPVFLIQFSEISYAAGKRRTFFFPFRTCVIFFDGKNVSSMYFLAQETRSRLQLRLSLCLIFSRWLSMVFTLRFSE